MLCQYFFLLLLSCLNLYSQFELGLDCILWSSVPTYPLHFLTWINLVGLDFSPSAITFPMAHFKGDQHQQKRWLQASTELGRQVPHCFPSLSPYFYSWSSEELPAQDVWGALLRHVSSCPCVADCAGKLLGTCATNSHHYQHMPSSKGYEWIVGYKGT